MFFCQFLSILQVPEKSTVCCQNPDKITLDGIVLSIETARIKKQELRTPWIQQETSERFDISQFSLSF